MSPFRRRGTAGSLALAAALCAVPLVLFGGSVTTLGAGMAVDGWLVAEGHFLLFFPVDSWFRDTATFVEHTHRLFGVAVGLFSLFAFAASLAQGRSLLERALAGVAFLAVCGQGVLGGLRVLENAPRLAFLHGAIAQLVFTLLCLSALVHGATWRSGTVGRLRPGLLAWTVVPLIVYGQGVLGALYRHALRPVVAANADARFALHGLGALVTVVALASLARRAIAQARTARPERAGALTQGGRRLIVLWIVQALLGAVAWAGFRPGAVGPVEWSVSILHVLGGGLLLAQSVATVFWLAAREAAPAGDRAGVASRSSSPLAVGSPVSSPGGAR